MIGVFAAADVFLFYVFFEVMLVPMYFLIGSYGGAPAAVRGGEVLPLLAGRRPVHAGRGDRPVGGRRAHLRLAGADRRRLLRPAPSAGCSSASSSRSRSRRRSSRSTPGCPTPVARPRPAPPRCWSACWTRSARSASCATACRCSRTRRATSRRSALALALIGIIYAALLAVGQNDLKRLVVVHLDRALRLHRHRHLRASPPRPAPARCSTWSTTAWPPACCSWSSACSWPAAARALVSDFGGAGKLRAGAGRACFFFAGLASLALPGTAPFVSRVPGADRHVHGEQDGGGDRHRRHHPGRRRTCCGWCSGPRRARSTRRWPRSRAMRKDLSCARVGRGRAR